ncbi:MAG: hypothetical protein KAH17_03155 [Bacteroidales bacterium]|nr:hypothetical protein [Bacteroidales bacterium]
MPARFERLAEEDEAVLPEETFEDLSLRLTDLTATEDFPFEDLDELLLLTVGFLAALDLLT